MLCQRRVARNGCFPLGKVLVICEGVRSALPGVISVVADTAGVCNITLVLSVWNCVSTYFSCVCACCNFCARFWLDMVMFSNASDLFAGDFRSTAVARVRWFSVSDVSWLPLTLLAYADVGGNPLSCSLFCSARRVVLNAAHVRRGLSRRCHSRMANVNRWD